MALAIAQNHLYGRPHYYNVLEVRVNVTRRSCHVTSTLTLRTSRMGFESLQGDLSMAFIRLGKMPNDSGARIFLLGGIKV